MRKIYVDNDGVCDTCDAISEGETVEINICDRLHMRITGVLTDSPQPCVDCPLGSDAVADIIPRCPRVQSCEGWDSTDDYDIYDYLCDGITPVCVAQVMEEL